MAASGAGAGRVRDVGRRQRPGRSPSSSSSSRGPRGRCGCPNTHVAMSLAVRSTPFGAMPLRAIRTTHVEAWVKSMTVATADRPGAGARHDQDPVRQRPLGVPGRGPRPASSAPTRPTASGSPGSASASRGAAASRRPTRSRRCLSRQRRAVPRVRRGVCLRRPAARRGGRAAVRRRRLPRAGSCTSDGRCSAPAGDGRDPAAEVRLGAVGADARGAARRSCAEHEELGHRRATGCSPAARTTRRTRTRSATGGAATLQPGRASTGSGCTTCGTSTPPD